MTDSASILAQLRELRDDSKQAARDAADAGNQGQADYETGRAHAYQYAIETLESQER